MPVKDSSKFVITGMPRSGTRSVSELISDAGRLTGHERVFNVASMFDGNVDWGEHVGESSWMAPLFPVSELIVIQLLRDRQDCIASLLINGVIKTSSCHAERILPGLSLITGPRRRAEYWWDAWNDLVSEMAVAQFHLDDLVEDPDPLLSLLGVSSSLPLPWSNRYKFRDAGGSYAPVLGETF